MAYKKADSGRAGRKEGRALMNTTPLYILIAIMFVLYFVFQADHPVAIILGAALFFTIIILLIMEMMNGVREEGAAKNAVEVAAAVLFVVVLWFGLKFLLNTNYPLDVVPSCSMLPYLHRGDMILVRGANQDTIAAPTVKVDPAQWNSSFSNTSAESLQCVAYNLTGGRVAVSQMLRPGYSVGLLRSNGVSGSIVPYGAQGGNIVRYACGTANVLLQNGSVASEAYTTSVTIGNRTISGDRNNSVIVYQTVPQDLFYRDGDTYVVHRVYAIVDAGGRYYVLTKGDNNPGLDIQYFNQPIAMGYVDGRMLAGVPYIGYLKLILSNNFAQPQGCNTTVLQPG